MLRFANMSTHSHTPTGARPYQALIDWACHRCTIVDAYSRAIRSKEMLTDAHDDRRVINRFPLDPSGCSHANKKKEQVYVPIEIALPR